MVSHKHNLKKGFVCTNCAVFVPYRAPGTKNRNHCPKCLASLHVDNAIGDRNARCNGIMLAIGKTYKKDGEEVLVHKCQSCELVRKNRVAGDDSFTLIENLKEISLA